MDQASTTASAPASANDLLMAPVNAFYRSILIRLFLREAAAFCAAAFFLAGGFVLVWKLAFPKWPLFPSDWAILIRMIRHEEMEEQVFRLWPLLTLIAVCAALVLIALGAALYRAIRLTPPKRKLAFWLDANCECGGLLSLPPETDGSAWMGTIKIPEAPEITMQFPAACVMALLIAAVFFGAVSVTDAGRKFNSGTGTFDISAEQEELDSKFEILEQEPLVPQEEVIAAQEALNELVENSDATSPAKTYEGIEALRDLTDELAANASRALERSADDFEHLSQTASALSNLSPDVPGRSKAMEQLKQLAEQLAADDAALAEFLKQSGDNLAASMTPEQLQALAEQLAGGAQDMRERLEKLAQARRDQMQQNGQGGNGQGGKGGETGLANDSDYENSAEALQQWLEENAPGASELADAAGQGDGTPGSGGISRGRGDAMLMFTGHTEDVGDERQELLLENHRPGQSVTLMEFKTDPGKETAERARAGNLSGSGQSAEHSETRILPSHRESVRRYFNNSPAQP